MLDSTNEVFSQLDSFRPVKYLLALILFVYSTSIYKRIKNEENFLHLSFLFKTFQENTFLLKISNSRLAKTILKNRRRMNSRL